MRAFKLNFFFVVFIFLAVQFVLHSKEIEITFKSTFDKSEQKAAAYIPDNYDAAKKYPVLVVAHYMGGNRFTAKKQGYYPECEKRGWLVVCPELHGKRTPGQTSMAALEAQRDIVDSLEYMKKNYNVDSSRIYLAGRSMGGMLSMIMAAKYPDIWAAVMAGQGSPDLELWYKTTIPKLKAAAEKETLPISEKNLFDIKRRSAIYYAPNFKYVPLMMWHGTSDTWVPPEQSQILFEAIRKYTPWQPQVNWLVGAPHCAINYTPAWICKQLELYQNVAEAGFGTPGRFFDSLDIVTDEEKSFFWLMIKPADPKAFARVKARFSNGIVYVDSENASEVEIELDKVAKEISARSCNVKTNVPLRFIIRKKSAILFETEVKADKIETFSLKDK